MYDLTGKVAIVTGVGRPQGIGRATALRLAREGARLVLADLAQGMPQAARELPLGRLTTGDDTARAIAWFASSESDHVTGQALNVNGGSLMS